MRMVSPPRMVNTTIEAQLTESRERGERIALATALDGAHAGERLLVWSAGHTFGDLGWPRLNQRVALYAEQMFDRGAKGESKKRFEVPGTRKVEVRVELFAPE
jgi:hypothetical protein